MLGSFTIISNKFSYGTILVQDRKLLHVQAHTFWRVIKIYKLLKVARATFFNFQFSVIMFKRLRGIVICAELLNTVSLTTTDICQTIDNQMLMLCNLRRLFKSTACFTREKGRRKKLGCSLSCRKFMNTTEH